jgi:peptidoglycan/LPS O-acetylase OafA/YrhL
MGQVIRDDIQFLRGLSVILIFLFHLNQNVFQYFYVGVDIFFIISGFVITSSIFNNIKFKKNFYFFDFLLKRIKRIFPNLVFFLIIFNIIFFLFLEINDGIFFEIIISSLTTILGISNFYYILNPNLGYFGDSAKWLNHTWSLSVELQFYLFYGIFILFLSNIKKFFIIKKIIIYFLITFSLISLYFFLFSTGKYLSNYFFSLTRFWEFFLGALIFLFNFERLKNLFKIDFIYFIFYFLIFFLSVNFLPYNLDYKIIIISVVLIICFCMIFNSYRKIFLVNDFFKFYGNISYSFFLWHMPIISLTKLIATSNVIIFFSSFLCTTLISYTTYNLIELPLNRRTRFDFLLKNIVKFMTFLVTTLLILFLFNYKLAYVLRDGLYKNLIKIYPKYSNNKLTNSNQNDIWVLQYDECNNKNESFSWSTGTNCIIENNSQSLFYILGNSYGDHLVPSTIDIIDSPSIYKARFENCYVNVEQNCNKNNLDITLNRFIKISQDYNRKFLFISLNTEDIFFKKLSKILEFLPSDTIVIYIYPHPTVNIISNNENLIKYKLDKQKNFLTFKKLSQNFNLFIFDTYTYLCPKYKCDLEEYNNYFTDGAHFKHTTSKYLRLSMKNFFNELP